MVRPSFEGLLGVGPEFGLGRGTLNNRSGLGTAIVLRFRNIASATADRTPTSNVQAQGMRRPGNGMRLAWHRLHSDKRWQGCLLHLPCPHPLRVTSVLERAGEPRQLRFLQN